jgi:hypothetical protein
MDRLTPAERLRLLRFVCSFAWTDLTVTEKERALVERLVARSGLSESERRTVAAWLKVPPPADAVDPTEVPMAHRREFLAAVKAVIRVDGVKPAELDALALFEDLLN